MQEPNLQTLTPREFTKLAHTARGFGSDGRMTLVEWIDSSIAALLVLDSIGQVQRPHQRP